MIAINIKESKKLSGAYSAFLSFTYNEFLLGVVRTISPRHWHNESKEWEIPLNKLNAFISKAGEYEIQLTGNLKALEEPKPIDIDFSFKTEPFAHQIEGFKYGMNHDKWLLADECGLGKSKVVSDLAVAKKQLFGYEHCLVICCINGLKWNWVSEIHTHTNEEAYILGQKINTKGKTVIGSNADKLADIQRIDELPYFIITNVESLRDENIVSALKMCCSAKKISMIATDEIHRACNISSQQGKGLLKLNAETKIAMTGTPLLNTPLDLYLILKWLGYETHSFYAFKNHYCIMGGYGGYQIMGYQNTDELREMLNEMMLRRLKEDVLDLPEKLFIDEYVDMSKEQWGIYTEVLDDIKLNIDKIAEAPNPLAQLIRLRQATGYTGILSTKIALSAKLDRMEEIVEESIANNRKVVIFSNWTDITDVVLERLKRFNPATITGKVSDKDTIAQKDRFQEDPDCKIIVGTTPKMGTGFTLHAGTVEIFLDMPWNMGTYQQAVDRCHRIGQKSNITIYNLLCKNTIDERIWSIVQGKGELSDNIVDGKIVKNKMETLDYLLS